MRVVVVIATCPVAFRFVDESQDPLPRRNRVLEPVAEAQEPSHVREPGRGSRLHSGARVGRDSLHTPVRLSAESALEPMSSTTVLFVDDDDFIRGAYGELLREEGFVVVEAADGC